MDFTLHAPPLRRTVASAFSTSDVAAGNGPSLSALPEAHNLADLPRVRFHLYHSAESFRSKPNFTRCNLWSKG